MGAADVIADWLRTHRNDVPAPAPAEALTLLAGRGAPAELIALYAAVGADVPGLLPPAVPGRPTTLVRPFDLHGNGQDRWTFARAGDGVVTWVGGRVVYAVQGTDTPLADRFDAWLADHLAALVASDGPGALIEVGVSMPLFPPLIAFDGWFVAADGSDRLVVDPRAGTVERRSGHAKRVEMLTTDGRCVVSVDGGGSLRCWWPESGEERSHDAGDTVDPYARPTGDEVYFVRDGSVAAWRPATGDVRTVAPAKDGAVVDATDAGVLVLKHQHELRRLDPGAARATKLIGRDRRPSAAGLLADGTAWCAWSQGGGGVALFPPAWKARDTPPVVLRFGNALGAVVVSANRRHLVVSSPTDGVSRVDGDGVRPLGLPAEQLAVADDGRVAAGAGSVLRWTDAEGHLAGERDLGVRIHRLAVVDGFVAAAIGGGWAADRLRIERW